MNILYVVHTYSVIEPYGVILLSSITKARGHKSFITSIDEGGIEQKIVDNNIDVVSYSFMTTEAQSFLELSHRLRRSLPHVRIIAGGPHPTYYPQIIDHWPIDALVVGEGDLVINELVENLVEGRDISHIPNVHTKKFKNAQGHLVQDLDVLPFADRQLLKNVAPFKYIRMKSFFGTRGCPFKCSYCFNSAYNQLYKEKGKILRRRSVENLVREIEATKRSFATDFVRFGDDIFIFKLDDWVEEFAEKYRARVNLPFYFLIHPNLVTEDLVRVVKRAGCHSVMMGIESGVERLRKNILDRDVTDETMLKSFRILRDHDIKIFSNTILGLPDSSLEDDLASLEFTLKCKPTYSGFTVFTPFPGTNLHKYSRDHGYLRNDSPFSITDGFPESMQQNSILNHITKKQKDIHRNILVLAPIANGAPFLKNLIVKHLIYWRPNKFFNLAGFLVRNYLNMKIWPFRKSLYAFMAIFGRVVRIDKRNYASGTSSSGPGDAATKTAHAEC